MLHISVSAAGVRTMEDDVTVLMVDDDDDHRRRLRTVLRRHGRIRLDECVDGASAIRAVLARFRVVDLVLIKDQLPDAPGLAIAHVLSMGGWRRIVVDYCPDAFRWKQHLRAMSDVRRVWLRIGQQRLRGPGRLGGLR